ncbi:hypothetical protein ACVBGC_20665 [Burkholderia stagnalis]
MTYTQAELRREFPVYDLVDLRFSAWLVADDMARQAWISKNKAVSRALSAVLDSIQKGVE